MLPVTNADQINRILRSGKAAATWETVKGIELNRSVHFIKLVVHLTRYYLFLGSFGHQNSCGSLLDVDPNAKDGCDGSALIPATCPYCECF